MQIIDRTIKKKPLSQSVTFVGFMEMSLESTLIAIPTKKPAATIVRRVKFLIGSTVLFFK